MVIDGCQNVLQSIMNIKTRMSVHLFINEFSVMLKRINRVNDQKMCINIYDIRLEDTSPACGMNWPPEMPQIKDFLGVSPYLYPTQPILHLFFIETGRC